MTTTCAEYRTLLAAARAALHSAQLGGQVVEIRSGEKQIKYGAGNIAGLQRYILELQRKVDACDGVRVYGRAIRFMPTDG